MRTLFVLCLVGLIGFGFACSGSGGVTCKDFCAKMIQCSPESNEAECLTNCDMGKQKSRSGMSDEVLSCGMSASCETLDMIKCAESAVVGVPDSVLDAMLEPLCTKTEECSQGVMTKEVCLSTIKGNADLMGTLKILKMFSDEAISCLGECLPTKACTLIQSDPMTAVGECSQSCNIPVMFGLDS